MTFFFSFFLIYLGEYSRDKGENAKADKDQMQDGESRNEDEDGESRNEEDGELRDENEEQVQDGEMEIARDKDENQKQDDEIQMVLNKDQENNEMLSNVKKRSQYNKVKIIIY